MRHHGYDGPQTGREVTRYVRVEMREVGDLRLEGRAPASDHLRGADGGVRAGALLTLLDSVGGLCGGLAALPEGWVVSTNLAARTVRRDHVGPFRIDAAVARRGRNSVVTDVAIRDEGAAGALVVHGVLTSAILVPENGPPPWTRPLHLRVADSPTDRRPLEEWIGVRHVDDATVEIDLTDELRNPWGILHGGVVASLVDAAAAHAVGGTTTDVVLHFVAPNRTGPVHAHARVAGVRSDGHVVRVELRDVGARRVTAVAVATVTPG